MAKTVIVGAGTIGLLSAYELRRRGRDVVVLDKGNPGEGASLGNAGWITPSLSGPVPAPGLVGQSIKWMLRPDSPLYIRPGAVPRMLGWLLAFWRFSNERAYRAGLAATAELGRSILADFDALKANGLDFEMHSAGLLFVFKDQKVMDQIHAEMEELAEYGFGEPVRYSAGETIDLEPIIKPGIAGSVWMPKERHIRPETLNKAAVEWLRKNGAEIRTGVEVTGLVLEQKRVRGVRTKDGVVEAEQVLIATGAQAGTLGREAGVRLPMQAGKGYSITVQKPKKKPGRPLYLKEARVAVTPFRDALRVAGTMELSGINLDLDPRRVRAIKNSAHRYMHDWEQGEKAIEWVGMRPMLPDGLPAIGRLGQYENLFVAAGHAMLGITLGPTTAAVIARLMNGEPVDVNLKPFDPGRFK
mgnify:CR=1 FL=1